MLKPNDTKDTFWYTTNDQKIINEIDFSDFDKNFKLNTAPLNTKVNDKDAVSKTPQMKTQQLNSLMEHTRSALTRSALLTFVIIFLIRLRNVAICKRKLPAMSLEDIIISVNGLDNTNFSMDAIELLQRIEPTSEEIKAYREFSFNKKDPMELTEEDR